jgi:hypothetical protein
MPKDRESLVHCLDFVQSRDIVSLCAMQCSMGACDTCAYDYIPDHWSRCAPVVLSALVSTHWAVGSES